MIALLGNLSRDLFPGEEPRAGGGPFHAARALRRIEVQAQLYGRCALEDREALVLPIARLGTAVQYVPGTATTTFRIAYEGERRVMAVDVVGDIWQPEDLPSLARGARWVHVAPLLRSDFPAETLARLARGRNVSLDGQGLVRVAATGDLQLDADYDPAVLEHVSVLKLAEEEAAVLGDPAALPVREVLVTHGMRGATVYVDGAPERVSAFAIDVDPTGAGDAFSIAYIAARSRGFPPVAAARRATAVVGDMLGDLDTEEVEPTDAFTVGPAPTLNLPRVVTAAQCGSTVVALVDAKPPLLVSHDAGVTWRDSGRGLPEGRAVAIAASDPDVVVYAARNRLYLSRNGGVFWTAIPVELPEIQTLAIRE